MRVIMLAAAVLVGCMLPACAESTPEPGRALPPFEKSRCAGIEDPAGQLFCSDPELQNTGARLNIAVQDRINRIADRRIAVEENVEWIKSRDLSCGIFDRQSVAAADFASVKACLLKETEERIAILIDPNFDCLANNTTAGTMICSDPALAVADKNLNGHVLALIARMKDDQAKAAFADYARWTRDRDRKCNLADKDNVPLQELSSSEACLADAISRKTAEVAAARGDPKGVFAPATTTPSPDADAVDLCVAQIHSRNACGDFLRVSRIIQLDTEVSADQALVTAEVEMKVLSPFSVCSPVASACTGTCWDPVTGQALPKHESRQSLPVAHRLRIEKSFAFTKAGNGGWRCTTPVLQPIELGVAMRGP